MRYFILLTVLLALVSCDNRSTPLDMVMDRVVDDPPASIDKSGDENVTSYLIPTPLVDPITGLPSSGPKIIKVPDSERQPESIEEPQPQPQPESIGKNDRIIVINTLNIGLSIRDVPAGVRIGGMFNGETGTVVSNSKFADGLTWVQIEWDRPVKNPDSGCGDREVCLGWSAVALEDETALLELLE